MKPREPQEHPKYRQEGPKTLPQAPRRKPRDPPEPTQEAPKTTKIAPRGPQEHPKAPQRRPRDPQEHTTAGQEQPKRKSVKTISVGKPVFGAPAEARARFSMPEKARQGILPRGGGVDALWKEKSPRGLGPALCSQVKMDSWSSGRSESMGRANRS